MIALNVALGVFNFALWTITGQPGVLLASLLCIAVTLYGISRERNES